MTTCPSADAAPCSLHNTPPVTCAERCATPHLTGDPCLGRCPRCGAACSSWEGHHGDCFAFPHAAQAPERHRHEAACKHQARWPNPCPPSTAAILLKAHTPSPTATAPAPPAAAQPGGTAARCPATTPANNTRGLPAKRRCRLRSPHDQHAYWSRSTQLFHWLDDAIPPAQRPQEARP